MGSEMCIRDSGAGFHAELVHAANHFSDLADLAGLGVAVGRTHACLLYTSDAADERSSVDLGGRRIIKKRDIDSTLVDTVAYKEISNTQERY